MTAGGVRFGATGLFILAVVVQVVTWSDLSSGERSDRVVLLLVAAAFLVALVGRNGDTAGAGSKRHSVSD